MDSTDCYLVTRDPIEIVISKVLIPEKKAERQKFLISLETVKSVRSPIPLGNLIANLEMLVMAGSLEIIAGSLIIIMVRSLALLNNLLKN